MAACIAEVFTIEDAGGRAARASLMQAMPRGGMLAVSAPAEALREHMDSGICIAAVSAPDACVVAGPSNAIVSLAATLRAQGMLATRLDTSHAFHSPMMAPMVGSFVERLHRMTLKPPTIRFISNVTGKGITPEKATAPSYWGQHILSTVRFADGMKTVMAERPTAILEVGPGRALTSIARHNGAGDGNVDAIASLPQPNGTSAEGQSIAQALAQLWVRGAPVEWGELYRSERRLKVSLPTYPFERKEYGARPVRRKGRNAAGVYRNGTAGRRRPLKRSDAVLKYVHRRQTQDVARSGREPAWSFATTLCARPVSAERRWRRGLGVSLAERFEVLGDTAPCAPASRNTSRVYGPSWGNRQDSANDLHAWSLNEEATRTIMSRLDRAFMV